jgi:hypothetical protein
MTLQADRMLRATLVICCALLLTSHASAQEPAGCGGFKFPIDKERALLASTRPIDARSGASIETGIGTAVALTLAPFAEAKLPQAPERAPKDAGTFAGSVRMAAPPGEGAYRVSLSAEAWIDVVQDSRYVRSGAFSGAVGCDGIRKVVVFNLALAPFVVQFSGVKSPSITMAITRAD